MTVAAILLAAGQSRRMGTCKQLLPLGETTVIGRCLDTLQAGGISDIIVVVSSDGTAVADEARHVPVRIAVNQEVSGDMSSSIRTGRAALPPESSSIIVTLCDYPLVRSETVRVLIKTGAAHPTSIIIPTHAGRRGHPLLIPRAILDELTDALTLRDVVRKEPDRVVERDVPDGGVLLDMDTPEEYRRLVNICAGTM